MSQIKKPGNLKELKSLVNNHKGSLSEENFKLINEIINRIENSGGVTEKNRSQIKGLMSRLAKRNGVSIPTK